MVSAENPDGAENFLLYTTCTVQQSIPAYSFGILGQSEVYNFFVFKKGNKCAQQMLFCTLLPDIFLFFSFLYFLFFSQK